LVATREGGDGRFLVRVVSENSQAVTGLEPDALFELRCFTDVLTERDKKEFLTRVQALHESSRTDPDVFTLSLTSLEEAPRYLFCAMHLNEESDLIICEFELKQDIFNPIHPPEDGLPDEPVRIIEHKATEAERQLSTMSKSRPLHTVRVARQSGRRVGSMELFHVLCEIQTQLATATTLQSLLDIAVGLVYELTSFHRVMVYQFDETGAGSVVSEIVDVRASTDIYRGLHFPASDIPQQARQLYMINKVRVLYDREQETARLVCRTFDDATTPLDLKHSYLRAMSPIHIKYLENMGVWASMSISLMVDNNLWGLISCHSYGSGMRVSLPVRELCRGLGQAASINIEKLLYSARIKARKPISKAPKKASPTAFIAASSSDLLNMFGADFGFLAIKGEARTIGRLFAYNEAIALLQYIRQRAFTEIFSSQAIWKDCPDILYAPGSSIISGMLVIPLIPSGTDFLVFFRKGKTKEIHWAGNPYEMKVRRGTASYLEPRSSFKRWSEDVVGISRVWTEDEGTYPFSTLPS
jgi:light-regulated signal transduction histidine kinase (bacteriophytochrome)